MKGDVGVKELSVRDSGAPHALANLVKVTFGGGRG